MGKTGISWTDMVWNPTKGCSRISDGCRNCYAEQQAARIVRMGKGKPTAYDGLVKLTAAGEPRWTGAVHLDPKTLALPLSWRKPRRIFVNSMSDLFHESLSNEQIAAVFGVMAACPQHTFQVLTKRARRMREWFEWASANTREPIDVRERIDRFACDYLNAGNDRRLLEVRDVTENEWPLPQVWLGVSVENQAAADERIPELLATPAAVRFLSCEPLIGEVDLRLHEGWPLLPRHRLLHWVIAGCESGDNARPCDVAWLRSLRDQCAVAGVEFFLKQAVAVHGNMIVNGIPCLGCAVDEGDGSKRKPGGVIELPYLDGVQHKEFPNA